MKIIHMINSYKMKIIYKSHLSDELLIKSFCKLSKKQIKILNLFYLEEYTNKEIAKILGESEQTISYNHKSAIKN